MQKYQLEKALINNEKIKPFYPLWEEFHGENRTPEGLEEYITASKKFYTDIILYKLANGESKPLIKKHITDKIEMICNYKEVDKWNKALLNVLTDLLNKYFSIMPTEHKKGKLNNKEVNYSWNKVLKYTIASPENGYSTFGLLTEVEDWINHKINGITTGKFTVDPLSIIYKKEA